LSVLASLNGPRDLRKLNEEQLLELCADIRGTIIGTVAKTGGHLGSSLGVVELTVTLHRLLNSPTDKIVWDTGHQAYAHKLLTGRLEKFDTLRSLKVLAVSRGAAKARTTSSTAATPEQVSRSPRVSHWPASSAAARSA